MTVVAAVFPVVKDYQTDASLAAIYEGSLDFVAGDAKSSLRKLAYAESLSPTDERIRAPGEGHRGQERRGPRGPVAAERAGRRWVRRRSSAARWR